ncbi:protein of unknown function [Latilactobacillus sakei]|nr:hypothetical protein LSAJ160_80079 [Latilactobacillus sakei]SOB44886.1 hypothetical protein LSAJ112_90081 [Latilactobacillus sakei]SON64622.1 protein of unknown function [Latilactobacillus sakei]SON67859.1 protein of unknown function [Latilactobacillus sakei]SON70670.1 protein of unknown function [Latilactobacillus sakei]
MIATMLVVNLFMSLFNYLGVGERVNP